MWIQIKTVEDLNDALRVGIEVQFTSSPSATLQSEFGGWVKCHNRPRSELSKGIYRRWIKTPVPEHYGDF